MMMMTRLPLLLYGSSQGLQDSPVQACELNNCHPVGRTPLETCQNHVKTCSSHGNFEMDNVCSKIRSDVKITRQVESPQFRATAYEPVCGINQHCRLTMLNEDDPPVSSVCVRFGEEVLPKPRYNP